MNEFVFEKSRLFFHEKYTANVILMGKNFHKEYIANVILIDEMKMKCLTDI